MGFLSHPLILDTLNLFNRYPYSLNKVKNLLYIIYLFIENL